MTRHTNQAGVDLIKSFEGLVNHSYKDAVGIWTIGYGHTKNVYDGQHVTDSEAEDLLRQDLADAEFAVAKNVTVDLNDNQFAALVSFVFNVGAGNFAKSSVLKAVNDEEFDDVALVLDHRDGGNLGAHGLLLCFALAYLAGQACSAGAAALGSGTSTLRMIDSRWGPRHSWLRIWKAPLKP